MSKVITGYLRKYYKYNIWSLRPIRNSTISTKEFFNQLSKKTLYTANSLEVIRSKETTSKEAFFQEFKCYESLINKLARINKTNFYKSFFEEHNDSKKTLDRIRSIINIKKYPKNEWNL